MSKIGRQPVEIPEGVSVTLNDRTLEIKGKNATLHLPLLPGLKAEIQDNKLIFMPLAKTKQNLSNWGTMRSLTENAVLGSLSDFVKELILEGVGFRALVSGSTLILNIGYSHQVKFPISQNIKIEVDKNIIRISGPDKALVGETAAKIRALKKPEPYKGKGFRYVGEVIRRKAGKKAVTATK